MNFKRGILALNFLAFSIVNSFTQQLEADKLIIGSPPYLSIEKTEIINQSLAETIVESLSLEEKANQLIMARFNKALNIKNEWELEEALGKESANYGGILFLGWDFRDSIKTFDKLQEICSYLNRAPIKPFIALDEEPRFAYLVDDNLEDFLNERAIEFVMKYFGRFHKQEIEIPGSNPIFKSRLPLQEELFKKHRSLPKDRKEEFLDDYSRDFVYGKAETAYRAGINTILGPNLDIVSDVDSKSLMMAVQGRTYGDNVDIIQRFGNAYGEGINLFYEETGIKLIWVPKHFPGLGATTIAEDPHNHKTIINKSFNELLEYDIKVYEPILKNAPAIMIGHGIYPVLDDVPASVSYIIDNYLRNDLGYRGRTIPDADDMGGLFGVENLMKKILENNALTLSLSYPPEKRQDQIIEALTPKKINERVLDIIEWKLEHGLIDVNYFLEKNYGISFTP